MDINQFSPLVERVYRLKNPKKNFLCPLCGTQRYFLYSSNLSFKHYIQIIFTSLFLGLILFPLFEWKSAAVIFLVWGAFEAGLKMVHRKEIPCPHCGFDVTWYKKDVRIAKKMVENFWQAQQKAENTQQQDSQEAYS